MERTELLVYGYVRIAAIFNIPTEIYMLCLKFYPQSQKLLICIKDDKTFYVSTLSTQKCKQYQLKQLTGKNNPALHSNFSTTISGLTLQSNVKLPSKISKIFKRKYNRDLHYADILFKCSGRRKNGRRDSSECVAYVFDHKTCSVYGYDLPTLPHRMSECGVICTDKCELFCIGGTVDHWASKHVYKLDLNGNSIGWKQYSNLAHERCASTCVLIENKVMILGGHLRKKDANFYQTTVELYDLDTQKSNNKMKKNNINRYAAGGYYDKNSKRVYLGGGFADTYPFNRSARYVSYGFTQSIEWYDIAKDRWYGNISTDIVIGEYPTLWVNGVVLNIATALENRIQCIDMRIAPHKKFIVDFNGECRNYDYGIQQRQRLFMRTDL